MKQKRKTGRKLLSFLLTLAMVVGLMPGMSLTAYADNDYKSITLNNTDPGVSSTSSFTEDNITINYTYYNNGIRIGNYGYNKLGVSAGLGRKIQSIVVEFYAGFDSSTKNWIISDGNISTNGNVITVSNITSKNVTICHNNQGYSMVIRVTVNYEEVPHTHNFTYNANGATITATCSVEDCPLTDKQATLTIGAPLHTTYGDSNNEEAVITDENSIKGSATVSYYKATKSGSDYTKTGEALASAPTDAGDYVAEITLGTEESNKATASVGYTIAKANPTVTAPTAAATYGQTLGAVSLSNPSGNLAGTWKWKDENANVGNAGENTFQASFTPTDTNNYNTLTDVDVTVTVSKAPATISEQDLTDANKPTEKTQSELYYTGNPIELVTAPSELPDDYSIQYSTDNGSTWTDAIPTGTDPGNYTVNVKYVNTSGNYEDVELSNGISVIITVDSSVLNTVIGEATTYHTEISDKNETNIYDTVLSTLNDAITRANNVYEDSNSTDEQVAEAISSLNTALKQAKESVKQIDDQNAFDEYKAEQKTEAGNKAQTGDSTVVQSLITTAQVNIESLVYDNSKSLEENKAAVDAIITQLVTDLTDQRAADAVIKKINAISDNMIGTDEEKEAIKDALAAYDKLTEDQKDKISGENKTKLAGAEGKWVDAYKTAQKNAAGALVSDADSEAAKELVATAKAAIDKITFDQSSGMDAYKNDVDAIIIKLKEDVADQKAADAVITQINALRVANEVTIDDKNAIEDARAAYNALTDGQKSKVSAEILKKLTDAEAALKDLVDAAEVEKVVDKINKLPSSDKVTLTDKDAIEAARKAYDALTDDQKAKVPTDTLKKLEAVEKALADAKQKEAEKEEADTEAAKKVTDAINALPASDKVATTDKAAIEAARKAYDALTADQKAKVPADTLKKLEAAEKALAAAEKKAADDAKKPEGKNEWIDGQWYGADGNTEYKAKGSWKQNDKGWWYEDTDGWYPKSQWQKIDGKWYYFTADGDMDYSEYRDGYWLGSDGAWDETYSGGHWMQDSTGWWYVDSTGWYPVNRYLWVDGVQYWFNANGYWE